MNLLVLKLAKQETLASHRNRLYIDVSMAVINFNI